MHLVIYLSMFLCSLFMCLLCKLLVLFMLPAIGGACVEENDGNSKEFHAVKYYICVHVICGI